MSKLVFLAACRSERSRLFSMFAGNEVSYIATAVADDVMVVLGDVLS